MLKIFLTAAAVSALIGSSAIAQPQPEASTGPATQEKAPASAKFITAQQADQWVFSKFKGTDVVGPDNSNVGAVNDLLFDKTGKIAGVVVGVGGFLGLGAKNVAIDMGAFEVVPDTGGSKDNNASTSTANASPNAIKLKVTWTKDQLKDAPDFQYYKSPAAATTGAAPPANPRPRTQ